MRIFIVGLALIAGACGQAPVSMRASEASVLLEQFAAGAGPADLCTPHGRALLRGAVRAYGAAMHEAGEAWPAAPEQAAREGLGGVEAMVLVASASGFIEPTDLSGQASALVDRIVFAHWPQLREMRAGTQVACNEMMEFQLSAARFVLESDRYERIFQFGPASADARTQGRAEIQARRVERARAVMQVHAALVSQRMEDGGSAP